MDIGFVSFFDELDEEFVTAGDGAAAVRVEFDEGFVSDLEVVFRADPRSIGV